MAPSQSFWLFGGGEAYIQARLPTYKKVCANLARERIILDFSAGFLVWLLAHPKSTRRVTLAAPLFQACSSLAFTLALLLFTCSYLPRPELTHIPQHRDTAVCLTVVCVGCPPTHSFCLRWQIIVEYKTTDADKCAVRLLQPFFCLHMRSLRVGALVPVCCCFHQLSTFRCRNMIVCNPLRNSLLLVGAQRREVCDPLISCVWHVNFGWL